MTALWMRGDFAAALQEAAGVRSDLQDRAPLRSRAPVQCNCSNNTRILCSRALPSATVAKNLPRFQRAAYKRFIVPTYQFSKRAGVFNCRPNLLDRSDCCCISAGLWSIRWSDTIAAVDAASFPCFLFAMVADAA